MALSRVTTWTSGQVLTASALNGEFDNLISNAISLISPLTASLAAGGFDITGVDELGFDDATANATAAGRLRRNGTSLTWHNGTRAGNVVNGADASAKGDTFAASAAGTMARVAVGADRAILVASSGDTSGLRWGALPGAIHGLHLSNNGSDAVNDIDIAVGSAASDDTIPYMLYLTSALTKQTDAAWAVGSAAGWLDIGTVANGTYHAYLIKRSDTGVVDALATRNPNRAATATMTIASPAVVTVTDHGLQAGSTVVFTTTGALPTGVTAGTRYYVISAGLTVDAFEFSATEGGAAVNTSGTQSGTHTATSAPVMPTSYDQKRYIGSFLREAATIVAFTQDGDYFRRTGSVLDIDATNPGTSAVTRALSVPIGAKVLASMIVASGNHAAGSVAVLSDLDATNEAPSTTAAPLGQIRSTASVVNHWAGTIRTSRGASIRSRLSASDASTILRIATIGWFDRRGKDV